MNEKVEVLPKRNRSFPIISNSIVKSIYIVDTTTIFEMRVDLFYGWLFTSSLEPHFHQFQYQMSWDLNGFDENGKGTQFEKWKGLTP